jgi:hypothetical protein
VKNSRETVSSALFSLLQTATFSSPVGGFTTWASSSRKLLLFSDVPMLARPALFLTEHHENSTYQSENTPVKMTIMYNVFVYTNAAANVIPAQDQNVIMDAIDAALAPNINGVQTLGGLVSHCRIDGQTLKDPGDIDGDGLLWFPIRVFGP